MNSPCSDRIAPSTRILGVRVDPVTYADTLEIAARCLRDGHARQIVTLNPEMVMMARRDAELAEAVEQASLVVADGVGLLLAGRLLGLAIRERVTGVDLVPRLCSLAEQTGASVYFLGAGPHVAEGCAAAMQTRFPALRVAGCFAGSPAPDAAPAILRRLDQACPDLLLVAYGVPDEEKWIARHLNRLPVHLAMGVGGAFDFIAGVVPRAPKWMQHAGLEWLFRLVRQPWRWRRMAVLPWFLGLVLAQSVRARLT